VTAAAKSWQRAGSVRSRPFYVAALLVAAHAVGVAAIVSIPRAAFAGYTHYWKWKFDPPRARVDACVTKMKTLARARADLLTDEDGKSGAAAQFVVPLDASAPEPDAGGPIEQYNAGVQYGATGGLPARRAGPALVLNGVGENAHETFVFPGYVGFNFCKTNAKPYDAVVTAALLVARDCFKADELSISSDGAWSDWEEGRALYEKTFGHAAENPFTQRGFDFSSGEEEREDPKASAATTKKNLLVSGGLATLGLLAWLATRSRRRKWR
jgi:hypothetical protein